MTLEQFLQKQTQEIIEKFKLHPLDFIVAASSDGQLKRYTNRIGGTIEKFGRKSYIVTTKEGSLELFTAASSKSYRNIFKRFIKKNIKGSFVIPEDIEVDHLYNKKRFPNHFVRLLLLPRKVNGEWGQYTEKQLTFMEKVLGKKTEYYLDYLIFLKAVQFKAYKTNVDIKKYVSEAIHLMKNNDLLVDEETTAIVHQYLLSEIQYIKTGKFNYPTFKEQEYQNEITVHHPSPWIAYWMSYQLLDQYEWFEYIDIDANHYEFKNFIEFGVKESYCYIKILVKNRLEDKDEEIIIYKIEKLILGKSKAKPSLEIKCEQDKNSLIMTAHLIVGK